LTFLSSFPTLLQHLEIVQHTVFDISINMGISQKLLKVFTDLFVMTWDLWLAALNILLPKHKSGQVVAAGVPGHNGKWPEYIAPRKGDSRSACPMLNAMVRQTFQQRLLFNSRSRSRALTHYTGEPWHSTPRRPQHHVPQSQDHNPPDLQLRSHLLLLRSELRSKLPQPLVLDRHLRPRRA
jgi:hypothetical protein